MGADRSDHAQQLRRALLAIAKTEARIEELEQREAARREPIAVVGLGCRFPGAATPAEYWSNLIGGVDCIREVPRERWDSAALFDPDPDAAGKMTTRWGGFLDGIDQFDPAFFGVSPREAARMDPQQRLALEVAWEALEDAAIVPAELAGGAVGVFMGACVSHYGLLFCTDLAAIDAHSVTGAALSIIANRISYLLDLRGPSLVVDTACSSSLVAIHLACQSLRAGECDVALAGGVNAILAPHETVFFSRARALASDGRCKAFDARADGFVRSEGCGVVVLKRARDARAAGDRILALVRGSAMNQDGTTSGLTAPNGPAQEAVIRRALDAAGIAAGCIGYVETHGTGTALGDPIEADALARVLGEPGELPLWLGAAKTNLGHLEGAAGVAGFLKAVLTLHHGVIPPNLHFERLNPRISVAGTRLRFPTRPIAWPPDASGRFAGVSSFGFGGTNAHAVLEAADAAPPRATPAAPTPPATTVPAAPVLVLPLSARSEPALAETARRFAAHLAAHPDQPLVDVCTTAALGRSQLRHRVAFCADRADELHRAVVEFAAGAAPPCAIVGPSPAPQRPRVAFLFTGQGSQYANMGRALYGWNAVFRAAIDECAALLRPHLDLALPAILFAEGDTGRAQRAGGADPIDETVYTQPALFALEYALVQLWRSWGVVPDAVIGHSLGEIVAAHVAGVLALGDALALVAARGQIVQTQARRGAMAVVRAGEAEMRERLAALGGALSIAAVNAPASLVIAGPEPAVAELVARMTAEGREARRLATSHAFHSALIEPALDAFEARAAQIALAPPTLPVFCNVTGERGGAELATASYWRRQLRAPVLFRQGLEALRAHGATVLVEIGPHTTLLGLAAETLGTDGLALVPSLRRGRDDREQLVEALARLWTHGVAVGWQAIHRAAPGRRVALPTAPFERRRYWYEDHPARHAAPPRAIAGRGSPDALDQPERSWFYRIDWKPAPTAEPPGRASTAPNGTRDTAASPDLWLIVGGRAGLAAALARELGAGGARAVRARHGDGFLQPGPDEFVLDTEQPAQVQRLFEALHGVPLTGVVYLAASDEPEHDPRAAGHGIIERSLARARRLTAAVLHVAQAAARCAHKPALWLVTRGAQPAGAGPIDPVQSPLWGLGRTLQHEQPDLACHLVDLDPGFDPSPAPAIDPAPAHDLDPAPTSVREHAREPDLGSVPEHGLDPAPDHMLELAGSRDGPEAAALAAELLHADRENQVALRGSRRLVARLVRQTIVSSGFRTERHDHGTWLITGGLGALGLQVARWLVEHGLRGLILFGRSPPGDAARAAIAELERAGATVVVAHGDVTRRGDVARALALAGFLPRARSQPSPQDLPGTKPAGDAASDAAVLPPLVGIVHAAGVLDDGALPQLTAERLARVMSPKLAGALHLDALTGELPLEAFVMFSSVASLLGSPGQASYAAGNAFLDALAHRRRARGLPALSINWGPWADVGMWAALGAHARTTPGLAAIPPVRGVAALGALLGSTAAQVAVVPIDWRELSTVFPAGAPPFLAELVPGGARGGASAGAARARFLAATAAARPAIVKAFLVDCFAAVMRTERSALSDDRSLVELGMDSLIAAEVTTYLQRELDLTLYPRELYDHPSIAALSSYVASELDRMHPAPSAPTAGRSSEPATPAAPAVAPDAPVRPAARPAVERLPGIAFILSSPRAGSTLLRVMLAGHPALFCPPELHLLRFDTLRERQRALGTSYLGEGLIRTVMELAQLDAAGAQGRVAAWLDEDAAIQAVYAWLQALAGARLLVDKSPSYASRLDTLERAEQLFDGARYVFLHRHPYAVIESFVRKRMNRLVGADADPHVFAEQVWATSNDNILAFLERIPPDRAHRIRYEELAREPERVMRATCDFLRVAYDPAVLSPYSGNRMTDGVHHQSVAIGDPDFLHHTGVDSHLAEVWRDIRLPRALGEPARRTAAALGYELPVEASAARAHTVEARAASQRHGPRESFVDVRGLRLCVLTWGSDDAPPVVCLHGILDHAAAMDEIAQRLVRRGVRVIAPDLRGHGRSGHVGAGGSYHLVDFVADVDALARTLGPAPFPLVGHSLGAVIAGLFAAARPGRISSLVLVEIALPADERPVAAGRLTTHLDHLASPHGHPVFPDLAAAAERLHTIMAMPPDQAAVAARRLTEPCDGGLRWRWDPRLTTRAGLSLGDVGSSADQLRELLGRVRCPVTWIHGDRSDLRRTARPVPDDGAREVVIRGGHNLHLESPDELAEVIASALPA